MATQSSASNTVSSTKASGTPLDRARDVRKAQSVASAGFSEERNFAIRQCQTLAKAARLAARKLRAGGMPSTAMLRGAADVAIGAIGGID
jgi:flagellar motor switch protein FliM